MIRIFHLNKWFNRHRKNSIHVINDTTLDLPDTGLVSILGESGSGKTTLLNVIGGLDKYSSGKIYVDGKKLSKIQALRDKERTLDIGYIFQEFYLLDDKTVFDNVAISLKLIGVKDKKEIKEKVEYVLNKVSMYRYRNRKAGALSGGERQRVAIARAIVKNPKIIIADEPTGNLDRQNTVDVMNIIKNISQDRLVLLVTHEKNLAYFYSDKIIDIVDGEVINYKENIHEDELDYRIDNNIYLKELKEESFNKDNSNIKVFSDGSKTNITLAIKNGNIYIKSDASEIEPITESSSIKLVNDYYHPITKDDYKKNKFDLNVLKNNKKLKYSSINNIFTSIIYGFNKLLNYSFVKKILLVGFLISGMFIYFGLSKIYGITRVKDKDFITKNRSYIEVKSNKNNVDLYNKLKDNSDILYVVPGNTKLSIKYKTNILEFSVYPISLSSSIASSSVLKDSDIIYGTLPSNDNEIVIDKMVYNKNIKKILEENIKNAGVTTLKDLVGKEFSVEDKSYIVTGVANTKSPSVYFKEDLMKVLYNKNKQEDIKELDNSITLKEGHMPNDYETLINIDDKEKYKIGKELETKINNTKLKVSGYYTSNKKENTLYVNNNMINYIVVSRYNNFMVYPKNKEKLLNDLRTDNIETVEVYKAEKNKYINSRKKQVKNTILISVVLLIISFVEMFLIIRTSFIERSKEVGVMRAIGVKKKDINKMFVGEILVITSIFQVPGIIIMHYILKSLINAGVTGYIASKEVIIVSLILVYIFNIIIGLLPINNLLRKTPHEILSRTDVN